jgi:putative hydrolase of HD superfamily
MVLYKYYMRREGLETGMGLDRLKKQIEFIEEIDKLKQVFRQTVLIDKSRNENSAEHSWHLALMAILLKEYSREPVNLEKVIKMVLIHDLVEIDAGDTFCYDEKANLDKADREQRAAARLFGMLPEDQGREIRELWEEFEECETPEARFAAALDRLQPLIHNTRTQGHTWIMGNVTSDKVFARCSKIKDASDTLWNYTTELIREAIESGLLKQ